MKLEFVVIVQDGENEAIIQVNSWEADVTFIVSVPAGVFGELVSIINNQARRSSIGLLIIVLAPAVIAFALLPIPHIIAHELSSIVVTDCEKLVVVVGQPRENASGCPDWFAQVYDAAFAITLAAAESVTTILFAQVDGAIKYHRYVFEGAPLLNAPPIFVIATQL